MVKFKCLLSGNLVNSEEKFLDRIIRKINQLKKENIQRYGEYADGYMSALEDLDRYLSRTQNRLSKYKK